jgi:hypothetical protein
MSAAVVSTLLQSKHFQQQGTDLSAECSQPVTTGPHAVVVRDSLTILRQWNSCPLLILILYFHVFLLYFLSGFSSYYYFHYLLLSLLTGI